MKNVNINLIVPNEVLLTLRESGSKLALDMKRWASLKLYSDRKLSIGQSAELAEMNEEDFIKYLGENSISIFDFENIEEIKEDLLNA